jgi:quinoprotein glucose dehydrogenase
VIVKGGNKGTLIRPSANGGANWGGAAVDPETGILYVPSRETLEVHSIQAPEPGQKTNLRFVEARGVPLPRMPEGLPLFKPPYSRMTAIDMNKGEHIWMVPLGNGDAIRNHPMLKDLHLPPLGGDANLTGPLVTKTLLISALLKGGTNNGPRVVARDKATGQEIASVDLPASAIGTPMTYIVNGKQFIALTIGSSPVPELVALALP